MKKIELDELKKIQLDILKSVDGFCRNNNIKYFLAYGTLIGAVRHKGYIPWDDDIDIVMLRKDYMKFLELYPHFENANPYYVEAPEINTSFPYPYGKVIDSRNIMEESVENAYSLGVNIDLFPLDDVPESETEAYRIMRKTQRLTLLQDLKKISVCKDRSKLKNTILIISHFILKPISISYIIKKIVNNARQCEGLDSNFCGMLVQCTTGKGYHLPCSIFQSEIELPFENLIFKAPKGYDEFLKTYYGNYMQLPSKEKRVSHHAFKAWWK